MREFDFLDYYFRYGATVIDEDDAKKPTHKIVPGSFSMTKNDDGEVSTKVFYRFVIIEFSHLNAGRVISFYNW